MRQRLFNFSKEQGRDFQSVLKLYFLERFVFRLSISRYRESFLLKGALLFFARTEPEARPFTPERSSRGRKYYSNSAMSWGVR